MSETKKKGLFGGLFGGKNKFRRELDQGEEVASVDPAIPDETQKSESGSNC